MNATTDTPSAFTWCKQRLGEQQTAAMLDFASHAALPVALNSELLHLIRLNFFHNAPLLDYTAEAELLLSPLCREIGADLYELLPEARGELLKHLYRKYPGRVTRLSNLIGCYSKTCPAWLKLETLRKSQLLTALLHLNPNRSAELIKQHQDRIQHSEEQEEHEWLLAMRSEAKLGEQAQSVRTPAFFIVSHLEKANPWRERPEFEDLKNWWQESQQGLCLIEGEAGTGKTALLARFIEDIALNTEKMQSSPKKPVLLVYSFHESPCIDSFFEHYAAWLHQPDLSHDALVKQTVPGLLILDGLEQVQDSGEWDGNPGHISDTRLATLLQGIADVKTPGAVAIIASRTTLPLKAEQRIVLKQGILPLPSVFHDTLKDGSPAPAMVSLADTPLHFNMGSEENDDEKPIHAVQLSPFAVGLYPVTVGEFRRFAQASGYQTEAESGDGAYVWKKGFEKIKDANWDNPYQAQSETHPVTCISWNDAQAYCSWLSEQTGKNYRLLTEAEWEYACRAGTDTRWSFGDEEQQLGDYAWYNKNSDKQTHPVGEKNKNPWGLHDMHGNVWEWCQDWYDSYAQSTDSTTVTDPVGPDSGSDRVLRGGSWYFIAVRTRAAYRNGRGPDYRFDLIGFRLARGQELAGKAGTRPDRRSGSAVGQVLSKIQAQTPWAEQIKQDEYGYYAEFAYEKVVQRMRLILPDRFLMGSPEDEPERLKEREHQHEVILSKGFWLADTACTQALWETVTGKNPSRFKAADNPVENISWNDAQGFIKQLQQAVPELNLRLPSEAQWEYACRAGTTTPFWFGDNITTKQVNYDGNYPYNKGKKGEYRGKTVAVKALPCNNWGLYQMHGNVREWCQDWYDSYAQSTDSTTVVDPVGPDSGSNRVLRGGSWNDLAVSTRAANRYRYRPVNRDDYIGFRLAQGQIELRQEEWAQLGKQEQDIVDKKEQT